MSNEIAICPIKNKLVIKRYTDKKINRWTINKILYTNEFGGDHMVRATCDCGTIKEVRLKSIQREISKSCGCLSVEIRFKHGDATAKDRSKLYCIWKEIKGRCGRKTAWAYQYYGALEIELCKEWYDYSVFKKWAESNGYDGILQLDRIDCNGNYEPSNCRFVTRETNMSNRKNSVRVKVDGLVVTTKEAAKLLCKSKTWVRGVNSGEIANSMPDRLELIGDYKTWSKLYPESR